MGFVDITPSSTFDFYSPRTPQTTGFVSEMPAFPLETSKGLVSPPYFPDHDNNIFASANWKLFDYQNTPIGPRESEAEKREESRLIAEMMGQPKQGPSPPPLSTGGYIPTSWGDAGVKIGTAVGALFAKWGTKDTNVDIAKPKSGYPNGENVIHHDSGPQLRGKIPTGATDHITGNPKPQEKGLFNLGFDAPIQQEANAISNLVTDEAGTILLAGLILWAASKRGA